MIVTGLSIFSCQGPDYFLLRQNYVKARTLYSYCLVFLTDSLVQRTAGLCGSTSYTSLHPQGHHKKPEYPWQPVVAGEASGASLLCSRAVPQEGFLFISSLSESPLEPTKCKFASMFSMPFFPNVFLFFLVIPLGMLPPRQFMFFSESWADNGQIPRAVPLWQHASIKRPHPSSNPPREWDCHKINSVSFPYQRMFLKPTADSNTFCSNGSPRNKMPVMQCQAKMLKENCYCLMEQMCPSSAC